LKKLNPLEERTIVMPIEDIKTFLILPSTIKEASLVGIVLEIGPNCDTVKVGDKILYGRYSGATVPMREERYKDALCMNESDILAIITEED